MVLVGEGLILKVHPEGSGGEEKKNNEIQAEKE